jgi:tetrahydromethanopterin S-methyltransferase subunit B
MFPNRENHLSVGSPAMNFDYGIILGILVILLHAAYKRSQNLRMLRQLNN